MKTIIPTILLLVAIYLNAFKLEDYDEEPDIDTTYPHTWLVRDSIQEAKQTDIDTGKAVDETKK